jgi:hypothetical protein
MEAAVSARPYHIGYMFIPSPSGSDSVSHPSPSRHRVLFFVGEATSHRHLANPPDLDLSSQRLDSPWNKSALLSQGRQHAMMSAGLPSWVLLEQFVFRRDDNESFPDDTEADIFAHGTTSWGAPPSASPSSSPSPPMQDLPPLRAAAGAGLPRSLFVHALGHTGDAPQPRPVPPRHHHPTG